MAHELESEAVLIIETVTSHTVENEATENSLDILIDKVGDLLEDIINRKQ